MVQRRKTRATASANLVVKAPGGIVTVLNPATLRVTLLEPWQREVLELCDGLRPVVAIAALVAPDLGDSSSPVTSVQKCLRLLYSEGLISYEAESSSRDEDELIDELERALMTAEPLEEHASFEVKSDFPLAVDEDTSPSWTAHVAGPAQRVFERLRLANVQIRSRPNTQQPHPRRRSDDEGARIFDASIEALTEGDLDRARAGFSSLRRRFPKSNRINRIIETIDAAS